MVNTTGIQTTLDCAIGIKTVAQPSGNLTVVNSTSVDGCNVITAPFDPSVGDFVFTKPLANAI